MEGAEYFDHGLNAERGLAAAQLVIKLETRETEGHRGLHRRAAQETLSYEGHIGTFVLQLQYPPTWLKSCKCER